MELIKSSMITAVFLLCLLLATPYISRGGESADLADSEVYEIDYRGPETHSSIMPPPHHSYGRPWINHRESAKTTYHKSQGSRGGNINGEQANNKIHG